MKRVIIPTDFSITALNAAFYAFELLKGQEVEYYLVNCYQIPYTMPEVPPVASKMVEEEINHLLKKEVEKIKHFTKYSKLNIKPILKFGPPSVTISDMVVDLNIDHVFVGTTGADGAKELFLGSNAYDIAANVNCPAWIVPSKAELSMPKNVLFAADFNSMRNKGVLDPMIALAKDYDSFVQILNVYDTDEDGAVEQEGIEFFGMLEQQKVAHSYKLVTKEEADDIEDTLLDFVSKNTTDLLVMVKRHYGFIKDIFHHSVTRDLAFHTTVPVLILHDNA